MAEINAICEIMNAKYIKLAPSVIADKAFGEEAAKYHKQFEKLLEKVTR